MATLPSVLIVDDDEFVRAVLRDVLASSHRIFEARDGAEAVEVASAEKPDVVLLDLLMPKKSGLEALPEIRRVSPMSRVLVISSMDVESMVSEALKAGADGFVAKPFLPEDVTSAVGKLPSV